MVALKVEAKKTSLVATGGEKGLEAGVAGY